MPNHMSALARRRYSKSQIHGGGLIADEAVDDALRAQLLDVVDAK